MALHSFLAKQSEWLQRKRNMMFFGAVAFGGTLWLASVWHFWEFNHSVGWILFLFVVWMLGGLLWGWVMWHFFNFRPQFNRTIAEKNDVSKIVAPKGGSGDT